VIGLVKERIEQPDCKKQGWLLDGFPRTKSQAEALEAAGVVAYKFIKLNVSAETLVERCIHRRLDPETGNIYHMIFNKPDNEEVLARLVQRKDDTEETIKNRLSIYEENVNSVAGCYEKVLVNIDAERRPEMIFEDIRRSIEGCPWRIMINGPPMSGKGAQVVNLVQKLGCLHMNPAMLTNKAIKSGTKAGKEAQAFKEKGEAIPDEVMLRVLLEQLTTKEAEKKGWVLDGFPRNAEQVTAMNELLLTADRILLVDVPEQQLVSHITSRRFDPETNDVHWLDAPEPPPEEVAARLVQRDNDKEEIVKELLLPYYSTRDAVTSQNPKKCAVLPGEGTFPSENVSGRTEAEVWAAICDALYSSCMKAEKRKKKTEFEQRRKCSRNTKGEPWKLLISGPPGSGKGALCEQIVNEYGVVHLSKGSIFHAAMRRKIPAAQEARECVMNRQPVSDELEIAMIKGLVEGGAEAQHGWLLDGYPRTKDQATKLKAAGIDIDKFIKVAVPEEEQMEFFTGRVIDKVTNTLYHVKHNPPPAEVAERCVQRADDHESEVKPKIEAYKAEAQELVDAYGDVVVEVRGSTVSSDQVEEDMLKQVQAGLSQ